MVENIGTVVAVSLGGAVAIGILGLIVWSIVWVYRDAEARGKPGWAVALMVLFLKWPISLLLWITFRPQLLVHGVGKAPPLCTPG